MKIGIAADHGGYELKQLIHAYLQNLGHTINDFGAFDLDPSDDYPDMIIPLAKALGNKEIDRAIAVCSSGVGATIVANKVAGVRACLITDHFSAHQGVEDDDMNMICLGGRITGTFVAKELVESFLNAKFSGGEKYARRLDKVAALENNK